MTARELWYLELEKSIGKLPFTHTLCQNVGVSSNHIIQHSNWHSQQDNNLEIFLVSFIWCRYQMVYLYSFEDLSIIQDGCWSSNFWSSNFYRLRNSSLIPSNYFASCIEASKLFYATFEVNNIQNWTASCAYRSWIAKRTAWCVVQKLILRIQV